MTVPPMTPGFGEVGGAIDDEISYDVASSQAPTNIAIVKYWGKDESRGGNTPLNSSCSLTLDPNDLRAETVVIASSKFKEDELFLNGKQIIAKDSTHAKRLRSCLETMRKRCIELPSSSNAQSVEELRSWKVRVISKNTFPTAAGLASSAAGYAALIKALAELYGIKEKFSGELSTIARRGSGSASRSLYGGLVAWQKGDADLDTSKAVQFFDEKYWPELRVVVLVASADEKDTPSTEGMQRSIATSPFLLYRANAIAEPRIDQLRDAYANRDFPTFAKICMQDSNSFHATCLDTFPPIFYMNHTSRAIIRAVHAFNNSLPDGPAVAYTFDAGPNAVCFCRDQQSADAFLALVYRLFNNGYIPCNKPQLLKTALANHPPPSSILLQECGKTHFKGAKLNMIYLTKLGTGASSPLQSQALSTLIDPSTLEPRLSSAHSPFFCTLRNYLTQYTNSRTAVVAAIVLGHTIGLATLVIVRRTRRF